MDPILSLNNCELCFRNASLSQIYYSLELNKFLTDFKSIDEIASYYYDLNTDGLERFLNATTYLNISRKNNGLYQHIFPSKHYSTSPSLALIWLLNSGLPDILNKGKLTLKNIISMFGNDYKSKVEECIELSLIKLEGEAIKNYYELETYLLTESEFYIGDRISHYQKLFRPELILNAIQSGKSQWQKAYGYSVANPFEIYSKDEALLTNFMSGMRQSSIQDNHFLIQKLNFTNVNTILDIGGGTGDWAVLMQSASAKDCLTDIYELKEAIPVLKKIFSLHYPDKNVKYLPGSFLHNPKGDYFHNLSREKTYDLISLSWVLHDWSDDVCKTILRKSFNHLVAGGKLLIIESVMSEDKTCKTTLADISMLLQTEGKERSFIEYASLLISAGFKQEKIQLIQTSTRRQIIEAIKM